MPALAKRKLCIVVLAFLTADMVSTASEPCISLDEFRNKIADQNCGISTARLIYIEEWTDREPPAGEVGSIEYKINASRKHRLIHFDLIIDIADKRAKQVFDDLRDVNAVLSEFQLPSDATTLLNVFNEEIYLYKGGYLLIFDPRASLLHLCEVPGQASIFTLPRLGRIPGEFLSDSKNPRISTILSDGKQMLRIDTSSSAAGSTYQRVIECDPSIAYRFRSVRHYRNGRLVSEEIADEYRDVNGIAFPFSYTERNFYDDGALRSERKYVFEEVQFGLALSEDHFKVYVPSGTDFTDTVVAHRTTTIGFPRLFGIEDALKLGEAMARDK